ncbi:MAG: O-antigen ligase family protein [Desulfobacterales bacterium]
MTFASVITFFILATIPILFAAVQPWVWSFYSLCMMAAFIGYFWQRTTGLRALVPSPMVALPAGLFFLVTLLQCLPLPAAVVALLSPLRFRTVTAAEGLTGADSHWHALSYSALTAFSWWSFLLGLVLFFLLVRHLCADRKTLDRAAALMIGLALIEAIYGVIQALVPSLGVLWVGYFNEYMGYARGTFINRNHFAGFIEMTWPLMLGVTMAMTDRGQSLKRELASDRLNRQALMALGIVVLLLALLLSRSRAGITGGAVGLMTFWFMARPNLRRIALHTRLLTIATVVVLCVYGATIGLGPTFERFLSIGDGRSRIDIWRDGLSIFKDHPMGIGLHNFETVFQVYNHAFVSDKTVVYAHNDYLQLLIETGWIGFVILVGGLVYFVGKNYQLIRQLEANADPKRFFLAVGAFSGIVSLAFHSFFDFNLQIPANAVYFVTLMALLSACTAQRTPSRRSAAPGRKWVQEPLPAPFFRNGRGRS